jgi:hypothetical protein
MVAFETLLLGLVMHAQQVRLMVAPPVSAVVLRLDGATLPGLRHPPWEAVVDLGNRPSPHLLEAIGLDAEGREVSRAVQWVNLPRADAEARLLLERDPKSGLATGAQVSWEDIEGNDPLEVRAALDGVPLPTSADGTRVALPAVDPAQIHVLTVEVQFPEQRLARTDVAFGGDLAGEVQTELTAVPLTRDDPRKLPTVASLAGRFTVAGRPVRVVAVEEPIAEVLVVAGEAVLGHLPAQRALARQTTRPPNMLAPARPKDDRLAVLFTVPRIFTDRRGGLRRLFTATYPVRFSPSVLPHVLGRMIFPAERTTEEAVASAVAVGGLHAAAGNRRRAVVLLVGEPPPDDPVVSAAGVRSFLGDLRVPLRVWSLNREAEPQVRLQWGEVEDVSGVHRLGRAADRLADDLERQVIVWLDGAHLPQQVVFTGAPGLQLAR